MFVYIALKVDFKNFDFFSVNLAVVALSILPLLFFITLQGIRFNNLLDTPLQFVESLLLQFKMQFFNLVLPSGVGGDAYRVLVLKHAEKSLSVVASKSVIDRLCGFLLTTAMFVWGLPSVLAQGEMRDGMLIAACAVMASCLIVGVVLLFRCWKGVALLEKAAVLIVISFFCCVAQVCRLWLLFFSIGLSMSSQELAFLLGILQLASLLPITVGGLGVVEGAFVFAAGLLGVASQFAALGAVLMRITTIASGLVGLTVWLRGRTS